MPTYRERLRREGLALAGAGAVGSCILLSVESQSRRWPLNTIGQLLVVVALLARFGPRRTRRAMDEARELAAGSEGSGEPTPLWQMPVVVAALTLVAAVPAGWDAGLRVTAGSTLVGLAQAFLLERVVADGEQSGRRRYFRVRGSRIVLGTELGYLPDGPAEMGTSD
ncbi:MAG: hypothetical protein NVSMB25_13790 [Thermoleophilaceae bacterium]